MTTTLTTTTLSAAETHGWQPKKLSELGFVGRGRSRHRPRDDESLYGGPYPFIQTGDIKAADLYITGYTQTYNEKGLAQSKLWQPGTLCITIAANIAETAILKIPACFPDSVVGFIADPAIADVHFVKYYIDTIKLHMQNVSRGTTQDNLSLDKLLAFDILTPPLSTQRKIAAILSAYDDLIENNTRRIALLEAMARALYTEWFVRFRFPSHESCRLVDSPLGPIPEGWGVKPIGDVIETLGGGTPSTTQPEYWEGGEIVWYSPTDLTSAGTMFISDSAKKITETGLHMSSARLFPAYSVMVTSRATIGVVAINTTPACTNQGFITLVPNEHLPTYLLYFWLLDKTGEIISLASGATFKEISRGTFRKLLIAVPDRAVKSRFSELMAPIGNNLQSLIARCQILRQTRDLLLPRLILGDLDVDGLRIPTEGDER